MNWMDTFIGRTLAKVPEGRCRRRMEAELRDHILAEYEALAQAGRTPEEAQTEALRVMGEPEKLKTEYEAAWRRTPESKVWAVLGCLGAAMLGSLILYAGACFMTVLLIIPAESGETLFRSGMYQFLAGNLSFWVPFALEAAFLRLCLQNYRHRGVLISAGLLAAWTLGTAALVVIGLEMGEYIQYGLLPPAWPDRLVLFYRDMQHTNAPWITPGYHLASIAGCVFLGWLFGRRNKRAQTPQAAYHISQRTIWERAGRG